MADPTLGQDFNQWGSRKPQTLGEQFQGLGDLAKLAWRGVNAAANITAPPEGHGGPSTDMGVFSAASALARPKAKPAVQAPTARPTPGVEGAPAPAMKAEKPSAPSFEQMQGLWNAPNNPMPNQPAPPTGPFKDSSNNPIVVKPPVAAKGTPEPGTPLPNNELTENIGGTQYQFQPGGPPPGSVPVTRGPGWGTQRVGMQGPPPAAAPRPGVSESPEVDILRGRLAEAMKMAPAWHPGEQGFDQFNQGIFNMVNQITGAQREAAQAKYFQGHAGLFDPTHKAQELSAIGLDPRALNAMALASGQNTAALPPPGVDPNFFHALHGAGDPLQAAAKAQELGIPYGPGEQEHLRGQLAEAMKKGYEPDVGGGEWWGQPTAQQLRNRQIMEQLKTRRNQEIVNPFK